MYMSRQLHCIGKCGLTLIGLLVCGPMIYLVWSRYDSLTYSRTAQQPAHVSNATGYTTFIGNKLWFHSAGVNDGGRISHELVGTTAMFANSTVSSDHLSVGLAESRSGETTTVLLRPDNNITLSLTTPLNITVIDADKANSQARMLKNKDANKGNLQARMLKEPLINGYVIVLEVLEQMESALKDLYQLISVTSPWRLQLVEPYVAKFSFGLDRLWVERRDQLRFSDLFNLTLVNKQLRKCLLIDYSPIIAFEDYMNKKLTAVKVVRFKREDLSEQACLSAAQKKLKAMPPRPTGHGKENLTEAFCVNSAQKINFRQLFGSVVGVKPGDALAIPGLAIVIPSWNGIWLRPNKFFYWDPQYKHRSCYIHSLAPSNAVASETVRFVKQLGIQHPYLGIHVRLERLLRFGLNTSKICLQKMIAAARVIRDKHKLGPKSMLAFTDYGRFGSKTCTTQNCLSIANKLGIGKQLGDLGIEVVHYTPPTLNLENSVFVSSIERDILASSDFLIVCGFGGFQSAVVEKYLHLHNKDNLHRICSRD